MRIRSQLNLMLLGVLVVPILAGSGLLWLQRTRDWRAYAVPDYEEVYASAGDALRREEWEELSAFLARRRSGMDFFVLRDDGRMIYSTSPSTFPSPIVGDTDLLDVVRKTGDRYVYYFDFPISLESKGILLIMRLAKKNDAPPAPIEHLAIYLAIVLSAMFAFSGAMAVTIARSITRSVTALDAATRRIAAGELDVAVDVRGSNEITSLAESLNSMRLALKEQNVRQSRFVMGVSHDLKTPLALIKGYTELIRDGIAGDAESMDRSLGIVTTKVDQLDGMIDDLMEFVKMDTGEWRWKLERILLRQALEDFGKRASMDAEFLGRRVELDIALDPSLAVAMDERLFLRALENLVNNALRYTPQGGTVRLSASTDAREAFIRISDDGPGIAAGDLPYIFDPFYRGSASRREHGFGLGLSIVKGVTDSFGWEIAVRSELGKGSEFVVTIPLDR